MNSEESIYVNIDLNELVRYLRDCEIPESTIEIIVNYCKQRREAELESMENSKSYEL